MKNRLLLLAMLILPSTAIAQACGPVTNCATFLWTKILCPGGALEAKPCHPDCGLYENSACSDSSPEYLLALEAAKVGNTSGIIAYGRSLPRHVVFNPARSAIQVLSCTGGSVVASLTVSGAVAQVAKLSLARAPSELKSNAALSAIGLTLNTERLSPVTVPVMLRAKKNLIPSALAGFATGLTY
jgi:hypothetical protein